MIKNKNNTNLINKNNFSNNKNEDLTMTSNTSKVKNLIDMKNVSKKNNNIE